MTYCGIVDGRESESADIEHPHGSRIMIEVKAIQGFLCRSIGYDCSRRTSLIFRGGWGLTHTCDLNC